MCEFTKLKYQMPILRCTIEGTNYFQISSFYTRDNFHTNKSQCRQLNPNKLCLELCNLQYVCRLKKFLLNAKLRYTRRLIYNERKVKGMRETEREEKEEKNVWKNLEVSIRMH